METHGHITPNEDGSKARCGGPNICPVCAKEEKLWIALEKAYEHINTFGAMSGGKPEEMKSQDEFFEAYHQIRK